MNNECIFCKIIDGCVPSKTIFEDELVKVFLDLNQDCPGHMLIIPKKHTLDLFSIDVPTLSHIYETTLQMNKLLEEKLNIEGLTLLQNNGCSQDVKHFHLHLIPKYINKPDLSIDEVFEKLN